MKNNKNTKDLTENFNTITKGMTANQFVDNIDTVYDKFIEICPLDEDGDTVDHAIFMGIVFNANREFYNEFENRLENGDFNLIEWNDAF